MNIFNTIRKETMDFTGKTAVIEGDSLLSYGRLFSCADMTASSLRGKGVARFHRVGLLCGDSIDYLTTSLAVLSLSAVIVPISPDQADSEIRDIIERISLDYLIFERGTYHEEGSEILPSEGLLKRNCGCSKETFLNCLTVNITGSIPHSSVSVPALPGQARGGPFPRGDPRQD